MPERNLIFTSIPHVFFEPETGKYLFADETQDVENGEYDTEALAAEALCQYVEWALWPREE